MNIANYLKIASIAVGASILLLGQAFAHDVVAKRTEDGMITIEGTLMLSDSCQSLGPLAAGALNEAAEISNAFSVTLEVRHSGDEMCAQMISEPWFRGEFEKYENQPFIVLYRKYVGFPKLPSEIETRSQGLIITAE